MVSKRLASLTLALTLSSGFALAQTGEPAGQLQIDDNFYVDTLDGRGGLPDVGFALAFTQQNGRVVVCAATAGRLSGTQRQVKRAMQITEGGRVILRGLQWAPNYPNTNALMGQMADCQITTHPAPSNPDFGIEMSRTRF